MARKPKPHRPMRRPLRGDGTGHGPLRQQPPGQEKSGPSLPFMGRERPRSGDRKSTRLNSSHTVISYAVFCLKKEEHTSELESHKDLAARPLFGRINGLINNAGTTKHMAHDNLDGLSAEDFQRVVGVNNIGPFQMVRAARSLLEAGAKASGRASAVVNVSSVAGISGIGTSIAYAASKGALNTITYSLARAPAPLIRVNTVCPGYIDTLWFTKGRGEAGAKQVRDMVVSKVPLKVASTADDIAALVCFLATAQSSNMTGELVRMDAGLHLVT